MFLVIANIDMIEISIENSYKGKLPSLGLMNKKGFSSKGPDRGLGLNNLNEILSTTKNKLILRTTPLISYLFLL